MRTQLSRWGRRALLALFWLGVLGFFGMAVNPASPSPFTNPLVLAMLPGYPLLRLYDGYREGLADAHARPSADVDVVGADSADLGRWWYGNAATVALGALALASIVVSAVLQSTCGPGGCGENGFALLAVALFFGSLVVGYASILTLWLDARDIRRSEAGYSPRVWLYVLGYLFLSPWISSVVYLLNRRRAVGLGP